jgi:hypothetical protein
MWPIASKTAANTFLALPAKRMASGHTGKVTASPEFLEENGDFQALLAPELARDADFALIFAAWPTLAKQSNGDDGLVWLGCRRRQRRSWVADRRWNCSSIRNLAIRQRPFKVSHGLHQALKYLLRHSNNLLAIPP